MRASRTALLCLALMAATTAVEPSRSAAGPTATPDAAQARKLANRGYDLFQEKRYEEANAYFREAERLFHAPTILVMIGRTYEESGKLADAEVIYEQVTTEQLAPDANDAFRAAQVEARRRLEALRSRVPRLEVVLSDPGAAGRVRVTIDGEPLPSTKLADPIPLNPGAHELTVTAAGADPLSRQLTLTEGQTERVEFTVPDAPAAGSSSFESDGSQGDSDSASLTIAALAAFGVGAVGMTMGAVAGVIALDTQAELEERCPDQWCFPEDEELATTAETHATLSTVGFVVGGLGVATGLTLLLVDQLGSEAGEASAVRWGIGPGVVTVGGTF